MVDLTLHDLYDKLGLEPFYVHFWKHKAGVRTWMAVEACRLILSGRHVQIVSSDAAREEEIADRVSHYAKALKIPETHSMANLKARAFKVRRDPVRYLYYGNPNMTRQDRVFLVEGDFQARASNYFRGPFNTIMALRMVNGECWGVSDLGDPIMRMDPNSNTHLVWWGDEF